MKKITITLAAIASLGLSSMSALAQDFKVGYVSLDRLIAESSIAKAARSELESKFKAREKGLDSKAEAIRNKQQAYEKDFPSLSAAQKETRERALSQDMEAFESERAKFEGELSTAQNQLLQNLLSKADAAIKVEAEKQGLDLVVQEAVYIKPQYDLTQRILDNLR